MLFRDDRFELRLTRGAALRGLREADLPALLAVFERALVNALADATGERHSSMAEETACP